MGDFIIGVLAIALVACQSSDSGNEEVKRRCRRNSRKERRASEK